MGNEGVKVAKKYNKKRGRDVVKYSWWFINKFVSMEVSLSKRLILPFGGFAWSWWKSFLFIFYSNKSRYNLIVKGRSISVFSCHLGFEVVGLEECGQTQSNLIRPLHGLYQCNFSLELGQMFSNLWFLSSNETSESISRQAFAFVYPSFGPEFPGLSKYSSK